MPTMAFMGVRISWLMLARKSDLSSVASTAASLAVARARSVAFCSLMSTNVPTRPPGLPPNGESRTHNTGSRASGRRRRAYAFPCAPCRPWRWYPRPRAGSDTVRLGQVGEIKHPLAHEILPAHGKGLLVGAVEAEKARVRALVEHGIGDGIEQHPLEGELVGQGLLGLEALVDVQGELEGQGQFGAGLVQVVPRILGQIAQQAYLQGAHRRMAVAQGQHPDLGQGRRPPGQGDNGGLGQIAQGKDLPRQ